MSERVEVYLEDAWVAEFVGDFLALFHEGFSLVELASVGEDGE